MTGQIRVEYHPLSELRRWPRNPKLHDTEAMVASMRRFGFTQPLLVDEATGQLVAGHGRLETLSRMRAAGEAPPARVHLRGPGAEDAGEWMVPVTRGVAFRDEREAEAYLVADNRLVEVGGWDEKALAEMLASIRGPEGADIEAVGFTPFELQRALEAAASKPEAAPSPREREETWSVGVIRQLVFHFGADEYDRVLDRLRAVAAERGLDSNSAVLLHLLGLGERAADPGA